MRRDVAWFVGVGLAAVVVAVAAAPAVAAPPDRQATVTLLTGDRVTVVPTASGRPELVFRPARGSRPTGFDVHRDGSHVYVVPDDVAALVPDVLDPALFDVAGLVEMGYDDRRRDDLPLIVRRAPGVRALDASSPLRSVRSLDSIRATAVELEKEDAPELGEDLTRSAPARRALGGATRIWLDRRLEAADLDGYLGQVRAPAAWASGLDGAGVTVAVLDTGVDDGHPALADQVDAQANFTDAPSPHDGNGHGTHVASLVAGTGARSDGARQGIATGADLLSGKVLGDDAAGQASWAIAGMEWAAARGADVVNMSLGGRAADDDDPVVQALDRLAAETGTLFVVAAGNRGGLGWHPQTIDSPGTAASALTVGAVNAFDIRAYFSSQGPTLGSYRLKPDVAAPGVELLGALAGARDGELYVPMSGTSQATPIVAGAAALLMQQHPDWSWRRIKAHIVATADPNPSQPAWSVGGGRLDVEQATRQSLTTDVATLDFGLLRHPDDAPKTRTVTVSNEGDEPVTLTISDEQSDTDGVVAPDAAVMATPARLTVPAGGTAQATVTLDPALLDDDLWQGAVSFAANGTTVLRLPLGVYDEPERYDLDVQVLDRNGEPYDPARGAEDPNGDTTIPIFNADTGQFYRLRPDEHGRASARVAPGTYTMFARVITPAGRGARETFTIAGTSSLRIRSDTTYVIDARDAERLEAPTVPGQRTEPRVSVGITYSTHAADGRGYTEFGFFDPHDVANGRLYVTPTQPLRASTGTFETTFRWRLAPVGKARPTSPDWYDLLLTAPRFPDPLSPALSQRDVADLARVDTTYRPVGGPGEYVAATVYGTAQMGVGAVYRTPQQVPGATTALMTAAPDVIWGHCLLVPANAYRELCGGTRSYEPRERVETGFGASLHPEVVSTWHSPDTMYVEVGLGDGEHTSTLDASAFRSSRLTLFKDGELVDTWDDVFGHFPLPDEAGRFRLEQEWTLSDLFERSRRARTVWSFDSAPPADPEQSSGTIPPMLTLDYGADVDELGRAAARRPLGLELEIGHLPGSSARDAIRSLELWWSVDDGDSWARSPARRTGTASFRASVPGTALRSGRSVSVRAVAADAEGNRVDQTVLGMVPVR